jgi:hypothetical protein
MVFKQHKTDITSINSIIKYSLALLLTSAVLLKKLLVISQNILVISFIGSKTRNVLTVAIGVFYWATVTLTSIGAGALGTVTLFFFLYYQLKISRYGDCSVPLTLVCRARTYLDGI